MTEKLTPIQRDILTVMKQGGGYARFTGYGSRKLGLQFIPSPEGTVVRCYGTPQYFLKARGFIRVVERMKVEGYWYEITDKGRALV